MKLSEAEFTVRSMNTHLVLAIVVDTRFLGCVTDALQTRRFASIGTSNYKDAKLSLFCSGIIGIAAAHHGRCQWWWSQVVGGGSCRELEVERDPEIDDVMTARDKSRDIFPKKKKGQVQPLIRRRTLNVEQR